MTVVLVTHDPMEAVSLCSGAVVLDRGRIVEAGPLKDLMYGSPTELLRVFHDEFSWHESGKSAGTAGVGLARCCIHSIR